jgi:hypothetical protein
VTLSRWSKAFRLALPPALASLAVTLLRLTGERLGWSEAWFSRATSGIVPESAVSWVVGITWLALPFGAYFSWRLVRSGQTPRRPAWAALFALAVLAALYVLPPLAPGLARRIIPIRFPQVLLVIWAAGVLVAAAAWVIWPLLARTLLAYGLMSRLAVVVVMFLAMRGDWGTHYDYVGMPSDFQMPFWPRFLWLAFFPQLVFWVAFTIVAGMAAGAVVAALRRSAAGSTPR